MKTKSLEEAEKNVSKKLDIVDIAEIKEDKDKSVVGVSRQRKSFDVYFKG